MFQTNNYTTVNSEFLNAERHLWTTEFVFNPITTSDVCSALQNLDVNKSSGPDLIEPLFLKLAANIISQPLSYLFNLSLTTKEIPQIWKSAFVVPLLKGGVPTLLDNYRPISKLGILSKPLEIFISKQLTQYLHSHKLLSINQSGFCKKHSTITAVLKVLNYLVRSLDGKHHCACLFIDLTKAFDTVNCKKGPGWNDAMTAVVPRVKGFACYGLSFSRHNKNIKMEQFFLYILSRYFI